ncbi:MAG TPA: response regulator, partial [Gemmatimonadales bacterium]|nr:response regulator [Gemmatimonadales bacterium]
MRRVLIVDDHQVNLAYLDALLGAHGWTVVQARHGAEALVLARRGPLPDVIVSDLLMPIMDGYTLLRHWKADPVLQRVPFIVYTATYTEPEDERLALDLGADAFVLKPSEPEVFLARLDAVMTRATAPEIAPRDGMTGTEAPELMRAYSETLIRKLEEKTLQLEASNQTLRESEERFRLIAETITEVFWISSPDKRAMQYVSPGYETIWGRSVDSLYAAPLSWMDAIHPDDRQAVAEAVPTQGDGSYVMSYRILRPDGTTRWIRDRAFPVHDANGTVTRIVGVAEDVTERREMEERALRAQRMESIGTLAGGIAHDLNNVLTPILMSLELLKREPSEAVRLEMLSLIESGARQGADMIRQVLTFARGIEGRRIPVDVATLVRDIERIVEDTFLKAVQLVIDLPEAPIGVIGDPTQLGQVLLNLCLNARDAMPEGGTLTIRVEAGEADGHAAVRLIVRDTGVGMSPEVLDRVFEPFFTTKPAGHGTGLGLPTALAIVRSHGGTLTVESTVGTGSAFTITLPTAAAVAPSVTTEPGAAALPTGDGELVLVIDDEVVVREITRRVLERFGYRVLLADGGRSGLTTYAAHRGQIRLVLTDLMMPDA